MSMLDLRHTADHVDQVRAGLGRRGFSDADVFGLLRSRSNRRRELIQEAEALRSRRNEVSRSMAAVADKRSAEFADRRTEMREVGDQIKRLEANLRAVEEELRDMLMALPNLPDESVPEGADERSNRQVRVVGQQPQWGFSPKDHVALGEACGILDFHAAAQLAGARFAVLRGAGARLERALIAFMLDLHTAEHGYTEIWPPSLVNENALRGTGQLPKFAADVFRIASHEGWEQHQGEDPRNLYLSPTAEVQLTNLHSGEILASESLPCGYTAYTPCFRAEAGSYGKDTRGLIRQHQFDKVELVRFCRPEQALSELERLTQHAEEVLRRLGLHYRVVELCAGDLGFAAAKTYDLEVWLPGQEAYREISSCSWFGDFQARRASIRYRPEPGAKPQLLHTLNGSALAVGRTLVAILEQCQQKDGSIRLPEALHPYMAGLERIPLSPL